MRFTLLVSSGLALTATALKGTRDTDVHIYRRQEPSPAVGDLNRKTRPAETESELEAASDPKESKREKKGPKEEKPTPAPKEDKPTREPKDKKPPKGDKPSKEPKEVEAPKEDDKPPKDEPPAKEEPEEKVPRNWSVPIPEPTSKEEEPVPEPSRKEEEPVAPNDDPPVAQPPKKDEIPKEPNVDDTPPKDSPSVTLKAPEPNPPKSKKEDEVKNEQVEVPERKTERAKPSKPEFIQQSVPQEEKEAPPPSTPRASAEVTSAQPSKLEDEAPVEPSPETPEVSSEPTDDFARNNGQGSRGLIGKKTSDPKALGEESSTAYVGSPIALIASIAAIVGISFAVVLGLVLNRRAVKNKTASRDLDREYGYTMPEPTKRVSSMRSSAQYHPPTPRGGSPTAPQRSSLGQGSISLYTEMPAAAPVLMMGPTPTPGSLPRHDIQRKQPDYVPAPTQRALPSVLNHQGLPVPAPSIAPTSYTGAASNFFQNYLSSEMTTSLYTTGEEVGVYPGNYDASLYSTWTEK